MIKEVYDQVKKQSLFDEVVKVEVKVKPDIRQIQEEIAFALGLKLEYESTTRRAELLISRLLMNSDEKFDTYQKKSVLIILDDLWEKLDLQEVGIPLSGNDQVCIKLFLTSRKEDLLSDKMGARNPIHLDVLGDADALRMLNFFVGGGAEGVVGADKVNEIATKCSGLPIVIEATAKALKNKDLVEWEKILKRLDNVDVLEKLRVSYDYLPSKKSKKLFLICGIIQGPCIQVRDLLKYSFGLGLYNRKGNTTLIAAASKLEKLLSGLEAASMLLKNEDSGYVKIHDHMRDLALRILEEDLPEWAYDVTLKLLLLCCEGDDEELRDSFLKDMEKLNVLEFKSSHFDAFLSLPSLITQLDHLRNLGTLCLHRCRLDDISMIGELKGLQILSLHGSDIRKLPIQLRELIALKMLDLSDCEKLTQIDPNVLGNLTKLEELNMENSFTDWDIDQEDDAPPRNTRLIELKNMSHLSNVRIHIPSASMLPKDGKLFSSKLTMYQIMFGVAQKSARELTEERLCFDLFCDTDEESISYPHELSGEDSGFYRKLGVEYSKFSRVLMLTFDSPDILWQDWVQTTLQTTEVLYLSGRLDKKCESIDEICIQGFECLKHLRMRNCPSFRFITSSNDRSSTNLESLYLESLESLEKLCGGLPRHEEAFSKLRFMKIDGCNKLTYLFSFSLLKRRLFLQLEEITVNQCSEIQCIVVSEGDSKSDDVVTLSKLLKLELRHLRNFSDALFGGKKVAFPCLESLTIYQLDELEHIWHPTDPLIELGKLRLLHVEGCHKLVRVINSNVLMRLQQHLESLSVKRCRSMKQVFDVDDGIMRSSYCTYDDEHHLVLFSQLKKLRLNFMKGLEGVPNITKNLMTMMKGGSWSMTIFPNIESLEVSNCDHLTYVLCCSLPTTAGAGGGGYEYLKDIYVFNCNAMEEIIVVMQEKTQQQADTATGHDHAHQNYDHAVSYSYSSLKYMEIYYCCQLRTFCQYICSEEQDSTADDLPFFSQKEIFPCLEYLHLYYLSKLGEIWSREVPPQNSFNMLKRVGIYLRPEFPVAFPSKNIQVYCCDQLMQIIISVDEKKSNQMHCKGERRDEEFGMTKMMMEMMFIFPLLRRLVLFNLGNFHSSSACSAEFPSLETLEISTYDGVKSVYSQIRRKTTDSYSDSDMVGALFTCRDGLVFLTSVGFGNMLTDLTVDSCYGLEYLFTTVGATTLVHLTSLSIQNCKNIKEVVVAAKEEAATAAASNEENRGGIIRRGNHDDHIRDITFSSLKELRLCNLWRLEKFSSAINMVLNFPYLEILDIKNCPNMTTFSNGIATTSSTQDFRDLNSFVQKIYTENSNKPDDRS